MTSIVIEWILSFDHDLAHRKKVLENSTWKEVLRDEQTNAN